VSRLGGLGREQFDIAVIGGGIIGCGIARDAALRGLRVALFEKNDFGGGTTAASTRIVHGGLRYLQMLDLRLVRLDLRERETLLRIAPHLVRPLEFFIPFFRSDRTTRLKMRVGLALYDALSGDKTLPRRRWLGAAEAAALDDALRAAGVRGAASYYDARVDSPERLALENALDAEQHHARVFNYCDVFGVVTEGGAVAGLRIRDALDGSEAEIRARVVVNATGAWLERTAETLTGRRPGRIRTTKGVHVVTAPVVDHAMVFFSRVDRRLMFAIPRNGLTWIGTTDTDYAGDPAQARATREDVDYVLRSIRGLLPSLRVDDVLYTTAGVRALVRQGGSESSVSRMHKVIEGEPAAPPGLISIFGGKITGFRAIAEDATDAACVRLGGRCRPCITADVPLPGARGLGSGGAGRPAIPAHLYDLYGARGTMVIALAQSIPGLERALSPKYPDIAAQVVHAVRHEHCVRLSDFLRRRTLLGASADQGWDAAAPAATLMASELRWSTSRIAEELVAYRREIAATQAFRDVPRSGADPAKKVIDPPLL
jgi:glycerol-3-phosphate dehydrogenase